MDAPELKTAFEELQRGFVEFKAANDTLLKSKADKGQVDPLIQDKIDRLNAMMDKNSELVTTAGKSAETFEQKLKDLDTKSAERADQLETAMARTGPGEIDTKAEQKLREETRELILTDNYDIGRPIDLVAEDVDPLDMKAVALYKKHFPTYIRKGDNAFLRKMGLQGSGPTLETKLMSVDRDPGGGYWVTPEMSSRIVTIVFETSPIREFATVENIASDQLELIADENQAGFGWVAEQADRPETTTPDIAMRVIHAHEQYAEPRVTQKLLDDAGFNVENWLMQKVAERFARAESTAHVLGTGVGQPRGFTTYADGTSTGQVEQVNSGSSGVVVADGLFDLVYSLKSPYLRRARFMMARLTIRDVRKLKDGESRYLWEPNFQVGQPPMLVGYPVSQADDMAAISAGSLSIAFGDFATAYTIVDRMGVRTLRDPYTAKPFIKLYTTRRTGGDVVNFEAIKLQVLT